MTTRLSGGVLERLAALPMGTGQLAASWLGQSGFAIRHVDTTILVDPFLAPYQGRLYDAALTPDAAQGISAVLCSHEHLDHFDAISAPAIAAASPGAVFVVPTPIVDMVTEVGIAPDRVIGLQPGEATDIGGLTVRGVPAMHGVTPDDAYGFGEAISQGLVRFLGYAIEAGGVRIYHAGDTIAFDGMAEQLRALGVEVALLPINGRDPEREALGIVGNLDHREAAQLASEIGVDLLIPMHHDLFAGNRGHPSQLIEIAEREYPNVPIFLPVRNRPFLLSGRP